MKFLKANVAGLEDIIWVCWKAQGGHLRRSIVTCFGLQVAFVGKLQHGLFIQIEVQSSRKYNLLEVFAHITESDSSSRLCTESRGVCKLCLFLIYNMFYSFHSYGIWMLCVCFQLRRTPSCSAFAMNTIFKWEKKKFQVIYKRGKVISCWVGTTKSSRALRWLSLKQASMIHKESCGS